MQSESRKRMKRAGFTLAELMVVLIIAGILSVIALPSFRRSIEQARVDAAYANLQAIWAAQRYYWVANRTYATNLQTLGTAQLIDQSLLASPPTTPPGPPFYTYTISSADNANFIARAIRNASGTSQQDPYFGEYLEIDATGALMAPNTFVHGSDQQVITPNLNQ